MKRVINTCLWTIIFLLVAFICVISIKKFFDDKHVKKLDNILATNYITGFVSFNKMIDNDDENISIENLSVEEKKESLSESEIKEENVKEEIPEKEETEQVIIEEEKSEDIILDESTYTLFEGLTEDALISKLEKNLKNELSGTSVNFVEFYKNYGLDPYLSVAIVLHETGCTWTCSSLVRECYNYGGMKGGDNKYKDTNYSCYSSKEEGINAYLNMLYNNYYSKGLTTPELINSKYATSLEWSAAINRYINKIRNS